MNKKEEQEAIGMKGQEINENLRKLKKKYPNYLFIAFKRDTTRTELNWFLDETFKKEFPIQKKEVK